MLVCFLDLLRYTFIVLIIQMSLYFHISGLLGYLVGEIKWNSFSIHLIFIKLHAFSNVVAILFLRIVFIYTTSGVPILLFKVTQIFLVFNLYIYFSTQSYYSENVIKYNTVFVLTSFSP